MPCFVVLCCDVRPHIPLRAYLISPALLSYSHRSSLLLHHSITSHHITSQADLFCLRCHALLGWTYLLACEPSEQYKVGKFILELARFTEREEEEEG